MGKGDVKSRRGKIWRGSYGNKRKRKANKSTNTPQKPTEKK
ncbi:30S ribosomal protein THX [Thermoflexibacter ruber]|uniref:Ribosomal small subunit protein bTHX n=1 Tax=Thermoflexibacter ruber TaxID=1003 RepID=A0A1I2ICL1_9BACT|nr:30S ribosomal protein THX [Thermoflexibacter ruber]SFF40082.1 ribosomal small subunit protein bTHX [Thermoflexibacter ruber]